MKKSIAMLAIAFVIIEIFVSGCLSKDAAAGTDMDTVSEFHSGKTGTVIDPQSSEIGSENSYPQYTETESQSSSHGEIVFDEGMKFDGAYTITSKQGDVVDISASSSAPALYVCLDEEGYNLLMNDDDSGDLENHIIDELSADDTKTYHQSISFNQDGAFYLVILKSDDNVPISGHIKAVRYRESDTGESNEPSPYDSLDTEETQESEINEDYRGTQGVENTYTAWDMDFNEAEDYGCGIVYSVDLKPGDTIEVTAETNTPANFISGDEQFDMCYRVSDGNFGSSSISGMDHGSIYQSESYSNTKYYQLTKKIDRNFFSLAIQNPTGDSSLTGHIKIVVHTEFTEAEHETAPSY